MDPAKKRVNPFYVLTIIVGFLFSVTASAYVVMTVRQLNSPGSRETNEFMQWVDQHGLTAFIVELVVLAVATLAAIASDRMWSGPSTEQPCEERD
jgi:uncharacterized membrane protein (DUF441 family)